MMTGFNISEDTLAKLRESYSVSFSDQYGGYFEDKDRDKATGLQIGFRKVGDDLEYVGKTIRATKRETTYEYVLERIGVDRVFINFTNEFKKLLAKVDANAQAYPTSYGLGIFVAVSFRKSVEETKAGIEKLFEDLKVKYTTEYSEAGWVFRYKISRSAENIELIKSICQPQNN
jgi:ribosomal protein L20A (L18A)